MRALVQYQEPISSISLHVFGDASGVGVATAAFTVVTQPSGVTQGIVAAKARLAKQGLTIPRLELVACHMATNLANNVRGEKPWKDILLTKSTVGLTVQLCSTG